ncbi:MAG: hypothetical protein EBS66_20230 [Betaproteobacteria bacterium]|nr:hypothetical protein [Betaproteobacteria bacterium]
MKAAKNSPLVPKSLAVYRQFAHHGAHFFALFGVAQGTGIDCQYGRQTPQLNLLRKPRLIYSDMFLVRQKLTVT